MLPFTRNDATTLLKDKYLTTWYIAATPKAVGSAYHKTAFFEGRCVWHNQDFLAKVAIMYDLVKFLY